MASGKPFRLLDLPPELRINIYEHYFGGSVQVFHKESLRYGGRSTILGPAPTYLLLTSKQIYPEALDTFYALITIRLPCLGDLAKDNTIIPKSRWSDIRFVELDTSACCNGLDWSSSWAYHEAYLILAEEHLQVLGVEQLGSALRIRCKCGEEPTNVT